MLQRDIIKEVRDAGVRVLKTDVAWVGAGYSFGLNGVADVGEVMPYYGSNARPFIISLDGWAGTQRYAGICLPCPSWCLYRLEPRGRKDRT